MLSLLSFLQVFSTLHKKQLLNWKTAAEFLGGKILQSFQICQVRASEKRWRGREGIYKEKKGVDTYTVYALWKSLERSLSLKLSIVLWFTAYTTGMWEKRANWKAHNTRIFSIILRNAFLSNDITKVLRKCWIWSHKFKRLKIIN